MNNIDNMNKLVQWLMALLLVAFMVGCGSGDDGGVSEVGGGPPVVSSLSPTVTATVPRATVPIVTGVTNNQQVIATFSRDMAPATINASTFTLACPVGSSVTGVVTYVAESRVATFSPSAFLPASTICTAVITTGAQDTSGLALANEFVWSFSTGVVADVTRPTVTFTVPADVAAGVAIDARVTATFSEDMAAATLTGASFTLTEPGGTPVAGSVAYAVAGKTATFTPSSALAANTQFTATVSAGAKDLVGNALAADKIWVFTTGPTADTTAPTVISTNPGDAAVGVMINKTINATFSETLDPLTITTENFALAVTAGAAVTGVVAYDGITNIATFNPVANLATATGYTVTLKGGASGVKDLAGNPLAADKVTSFTTTTSTTPVPVPVHVTAPSLGAATPFGSFGGGAGMTNQGILTVINGDIGTTGASTTLTGFHDLAGDVYTETPLNIGAVNGRIYTAAPPPGGAGAGGTAATFAVATAAANDSLAAFNSMSPASLPGGADPGAGQLGGLTLAPGIYQAAGGAFLLTGSDLTLDGQGDSNAVWVFQMASSLTVGAAGAPRSVILTNGAQAKNIFWYVGSAATINGAGGGTMVGTIIASAGVTISTAGNVNIVTLNGRALGLNASVTVVNTVINVPAP